MSEASIRFRIASYNTHKCRGINGTISHARVIRVIEELDADILCLQEIVDAEGGTGKFDQARQISRAFPELNVAFGETRPLRGGRYGNMLMTRFPIVETRTHDITKSTREERGVLQCAVELEAGVMVNVFNVHLGTGYMERRRQIGVLFGPAILEQPGLNGPRIVIGDFNEWTRGLTTRLLQQSFQSHRPIRNRRSARTYPGALPILSLDHCYYEAPLEMEHTKIWRSPRAIIASDHLPLIADFIYGSSKADDGRLKPFALPI
jgi:endonuclease/exonuclease/phosphatase family metal-dependent hydrolase